jgi:hypothetical protein
MKRWPIPTIAVVTALLLGLGVPELDAAVDDQLSGRASARLFGGDADAARSPGFDLAERHALDVLARRVEASLTVVRPTGEE